ncbi:hypothetical protein D3879_15300 [Pseudomonas cavernicola]|uniref:Uncharacterized protein n=1 Tax=Pseudomonas cavernicola TaxID=2320866 RepID=A0A418XET6_9PSED|nr:hypothetical protein D3879_15300 [Pseudomonas cavernicola]
MSLSFTRLQWCWSAALDNDRNLHVVSEPNLFYAYRKE